MSHIFFSRAYCSHRADTPGTRPARSGLWNFIGGWGFEFSGIFG